MRIKKILFLIIFLFSSNNIVASEIGGIRIFQSTEGFLKIDDDNNEWREKEFNKDIRFYANDIFNLSFNSEHKSNDFEISNPDYFFKEYYIWEKEKEVIGIFAYRPLQSNILQQNFNIGECEQLRNQLALEKEVKFNEEIKKTRSKSYYRSTEENVIYYEDRLSFNYTINDISVSHLFICYYEILFEKNADLGKKHIISVSIGEEIFANNFLNQYEIFHNVEEIEEFNSNYIKNFKIWGNIKEINYNDGEIYLLENYRLKSFQKHDKIKKQQEIEAQKKAEEEKKKQVIKKKINKFEKEIEEKLILIQNKKLQLSEKINFLEKPLIDLKNSFEQETKLVQELISLVEDQQHNFEEKFWTNYDDCFPKSFNIFVKPYESVKAKLVLKDKTNFLNYSINYQPFNETNDKSLYYYDFVKNHKNCIVQLSILDKYSTLDLNNIDLRFFNETSKFNLEIIELNTSTKSKLDSSEKKITSLSKEIEDNVKTISLEITELENKYNSEVNIIKKQIVDIENQISNLYEKNKTLFSSSELLKLKKNNEVKKIEIKEEFEKEKTNNDVDKNQVKSIEFSGLTLSEEDALKAQIFGCWSIPLGLPYNENLLVRIKLKLKPDGSIIKAEILDQERMKQPGQGFYKVLAESALRAVKLCQPLKVPTSGYERWKELYLNFDAREMLGG